MEQDKLILTAKEGASLSSGSLRLYGTLASTPEGDTSQEGTPAYNVVGCIDLYNYDPLNKRCAVGIMVASEYRRQGYALAMLRILETQYTASLHTLYADIAAFNTASIALFAKAGYTECGRFKEWLEYDSHFIDNIRMQKLL